MRGRGLDCFKGVVDGKGSVGSIRDELVDPFVVFILCPGTLLYIVSTVQVTFSEKNIF